MSPASRGKMFLPPCDKQNNAADYVGDQTQRENRW
jgi:hypothetical protein